LGEDDVGEGDGFIVGDQLGEAFDLPGPGVTEEVDPHRGVDDDHRAARLRSRSPSHVTVPRSASALCRSLRRTSSRRANSTVAFLPLVPATAWARAKSSSSISMFVRTHVVYTFRMTKCVASMRWPHHPRAGRHGPGAAD